MHSLKAFLFCCYTGVRYSDFVLLNENNIVTIKGEKWLIFKTVKTDTKVSIPLYLLFQGKALRLLQEYHQNLSDFFHLQSNSSVNKDLKRIGVLAKIEKHFSFHSGSHSKFFYLLNISELSILKNMTANDLETSYILFLSQLCNIQRTL